MLDDRADQSGEGLLPELPDGLRPRTGELQEVFDEPLEVAEAADHQVERLLGAFGELVASPLERSSGERQGRHRRAQLVADIAGEAGLLFQPLQQHLGHPVERLGQTGEIGIGIVVESFLEVPRGDPSGDVRGRGQRAQRPPGRPDAEQTTRGRGEQRPDDQ